MDQPKLERLLRLMKILYTVNIYKILAETIVNGRHSSILSEAYISRNV